MENTDVLIQLMKEHREESRERHERSERKLEDIYTQTLKTNGRVTSLEKTASEHDEVIEKHKDILSRTAGGARVIMWALGIVGFGLGVLFTWWINKH